MSDDLKGEVRVLAGRCAHHFDKTCGSCELAMDVTNGEICRPHDRIEELEAALQQQEAVGLLREVREIAHDGWDNGINRSKTIRDRIDAYLSRNMQGDG